MVVCPICGEPHAACGGSTTDPDNPNRIVLDLPEMAQPKASSLVMWRSPKRLYIDKDGVTVTEKATATSDTLLVGEGGELPLERAKALGLVEGEEAVVAEPASTVVFAVSQADHDEAVSARTTAEGERDKARGDLATANADHDATKGELKKARTDLAAAEKERDTKAAALTKAQGDLANLEETHATTAADLKKAQADLKAVTAERDRLAKAKTTDAPEA